MVTRGFKEEQLIQYPTDKINLIYEYAKREEANDHLMRLETLHTAFASVMGDKESFNAYERLRSALLELSSVDQAAGKDKKQKRMLKKLLSDGLIGLIE